MKKASAKDEFVIDSHAILTYLHEDAGWQEVGRLLRFWQRKQIRARLNWLNWGEIFYITARMYSREKAEEVMDFIASYPLLIEAIDFELVRSAAELKSLHSFSYANAFCAATALKYRATLVTCDPEFRALEDKLHIRWID